MDAQASEIRAEAARGVRLYLSWLYWIFRLPDAASPHLGISTGGYLWTGSFVPDLLVPYQEASLVQEDSA